MIIIFTCDDELELALVNISLVYQTQVINMVLTATQMTAFFEGGKPNGDSS